MSSEEGLVDRNVLDADRALVRDDIDDLVDHQERVAVGDHLLDAENIEFRHPTFGLARRIHLYVSFFSAKRLTVAT
jgi:hypothetical protein